MATFSDIGKDVNDQFTKDLAKEQNVELSAKYNDYFSLLLKGNIKSGIVDATFAPTIKIPDYSIEVKPELSTPDKNEKTYKVDISANDAFTKGLKFEFGTSNGNKGELYLGTIYKNSRFGGVTGRLTFPEGKDKFITPSVYLESQEVAKGVGVGATAKIVIGETTQVESLKALASYKNDSISGFFGFEKKPNEPKPAPKSAPKSEGKEEKKVEQKEDKKVDQKFVEKAPESSVHLVGGVLKKLSSEDKTFGVNGSYNTSATENALNLEFLLRKNYSDGSFLKLRGNIEGNVGVSRQFKHSDVTVVLGTNVNVFTGIGNAGFQLNTAL